MNCQQLNKFSNCLRSAPALALEGCHARLLAVCVCVRCVCMCCVCGVCCVCRSQRQFTATTRIQNAKSVDVHLHSHSQAQSLPASVPAPHPTANPCPTPLPCTPATGFVLAAVAIHSNELDDVAVVQQFEPFRAARASAALLAAGGAAWRALRWGCTRPLVV